MKKTLLYLGLAAVAGIAIAVTLRLDPPNTRVPTAAPDPAVYASRPAISPAGSGPSMDSELRELRRMLQQEIRARRQLELELAELERLVARLEGDPDRSAARDVDEGAAAVETAAVETAAVDTAARDWFDEQALIAAGMDNARAYELRLFFEQLEFERLQLRDRAAREGWESTRRRAEFEALEDREATLRERLGEDEYAAYLYASGRPNRVEVTSVLASAPAGQAGIRSGDRILRYANERIYSPRELRAATAAGTFGDPVEIEVERDGETLQFYLARGPMGIRTDSLSLAP